METKLLSDFKSERLRTGYSLLRKGSNNLKAEIEIIGFNEDIVTASNYDDGEADPFDF